MSLTVTFHKTNSPKNKITKTLDAGIPLACVLKDDCSVLNPVVNVLAGSDITGCNYMSIPGLNNRYYFIDDIISTENGYWTVSGHVDVLMTYAQQILANSAVIRRNQYKYNTYLNDSEWNTYAYDDVITFKFSDSGFTKDLQYLFTVAGGALV